ncbi:HAMP domain-containing protein [Pseudoflavonifractor sp. AF19-9AC]|uniref:Na+/H+ antiporter NhaC family protein n=1 Tax=Pseudoflavonifractor sp. AF19-9AC TaxID=2292244 RepID=UPI000E550F01|nr:Na+/H+ antiporter NhaC family protein [Pseudoflavonifractor sp. AF19-9AC]RHR08058.1 HAMP domain-containing protein [Pseudoflavonifractor sp. AF19-9AC]
MGQPSLKLSLVGTLGALVILFLGLFVLHLEITLLLFLDMIYVAMIARIHGIKVAELVDGMSSGCAQALTGLLFFPLIGALIGSWIHCGTIPVLLYHGLNILNPRYFLVTAFLLCSLVSLIIGTSWGTVGTLGIVIVGVAEGGSIDLPAGLIVGSIVSGAWFGDKMSPISDSTLLTTTVTEVDVYRHVQVMAYTTLPSYLLTVVVFGVLNRVLASGAEMDGAILLRMQTALAGQYNLSFLAILPPILLMALCLLRVHVFVALLSGIGAGVVCSVLTQHSTISAAMTALMSGGQGETGVDALDTLLSQGGIDAMINGFYLCLLAVCLGGALQRAGFFSSIIRHCRHYLKSDFSLLLATMVTSVLGNCVFADNYLSMVLNGNVYRPLYQEHRLSLAMLSRTIEEGSTLSAPLIPWTAAGVFISETLGVPVSAYAPFVVLNLLTPVVSLTMSRFGVGVVTQYAQEHPRPRWYRRYKIKNNLRSKLLLVFLTIGVVPTVVLSLLFYSIQGREAARQAQAQLDRGAQRTVALVQSGLEAAGEGSESREEALAALRRLPYVETAETEAGEERFPLETQWGTVFLTLDRAYLQQMLYGEEERGAVYVVCTDQGGTDALQEELGQSGDTLSARAELTPQCTLVLTEDARFLRENQGVSGTVVVRLAMVLAILAVCSACLISYNMSRGIRALADNMRKIQSGDFETASDLDVGDDEIGMLNRTFSQMKLELDKLVNRTLRLKLSERDAKLKALQSQISPHFLYNALDSINWDLVEKGEYEISEILLSLSDMLHYSLDQFSGQVFLAMEFEQAENYLKIQKHRFGDRFDYEISCPEDVEREMAPKMLLQPLVENAVSHGLEDREHGLVRVTACRREGTVQITVEDNGCGMDEELLAQLRDRLARKEYAGEQGEHIGLVNVSHRLRYMYGDRARLLLESQVNAYTRVTVELPLETERMEEETDEHSDCGR